MKMRDNAVVLGLSGGVDSAVAARLLLEQGYEIHPLWLDIGLGGGEDARQVAQSLGLPFYRADIQAQLEEAVCTPFAQDYLAGRTPLPCARCNPAVKFHALLSLADQLGIRWVATGHYARAEHGGPEGDRLLRGRPANDQSYMLARLTRAQLSRVLFPLGGYEKTHVRALARGYGIPVADKPDSMEICFIPDGDYASWLERRGITPPPGEFVDREGRVLGRHRGIHHYTLGQRRGLGISAASRLFVSAIRPEQNQVVLSTGEDLYVERAYCEQLNWLLPEAPEGQLEGTVRLRHSKGETPVTLRITEGAGEMQFHTPARAPTPGQLAVFYQGDQVLGSGWIAERDKS
jgi:tRNA-specific 2-thiouridylase